MIRRLLISACLLLTVRAATAEEPWDNLRPIGEATVVSTVDGDTVVIEPALLGYEQVRLVGIQAPKLPLGRKNFPTWPLAPESKDALAALVDGQRVTLFAGQSPVDRHGRHLAHLRRADGLWVQGEMLRQGWARVYSFPDNRLVVPDMLALERESRTNGAGIWSHPNYAVRGPDDLGDLIGRFEIVEGKVVAAEVHKGTGYLNFGKDWRSDFTLVIRKRALAVFKEAGIDIAAYAGQRIRARGWLKERNGPMIEVTHPEQIETLAPPS